MIFYKESLRTCTGVVGTVSMGIEEKNSQTETWMDRELAGCKFRDVRLEKRFRKLIEQLSGALGESIPMVCRDWANTKGAYRFSSNERVSEEEILAGHFQPKRERALVQSDPVVVLHDTTEFIFKREDIDSVGRLNKGAAGKNQPWPHQLLHELRNSDALESGGHDRGSPSGIGGDQILDTLRWKIELFHKIVKSGCRAEESKLRTADQLVNLISVFCVLSWRIFWLAMINRIAPEASPRLALTEIEIGMDELHKDKPPNRPPKKTLSTYLEKIARVSRKRWAREVIPCQ